MSPSAYDKICELAPGTWFTIRAGHYTCVTPGPDRTESTQAGTYMVLGEHWGGWFQVLRQTGEDCWINPGWMYQGGVCVLEEE